MLEHSLLADLNQARETRQAAILVRDLSSGQGRLVHKSNLSEADPLFTALKSRFVSGKSGTEIVGGREFFLNVEVPATRIIIIGAVHISQALVPMVQQCGFDLTIIDPRTAFATPERFADVDMHAEWPEDIWTEHMVDAYTAIVVITHDPKIDDFPLIKALEAECFYIGALGSRKTHAKRVERLKDAGISDAQLARIDAPIGLDIGAVTPAEIAVAILGQIINALRQGRA